jgi:hypothetical protein
MEIVAFIVLNFNLTFPLKNIRWTHGKNEFIYSR